MRKPRGSNGPTENSIQTDLVGELTVKLRPDVYFTAIPNGDLRHWNVAIRLKAMGVKPGVSDIVFIAPRGVSAWLEMKTQKGSLSDEQHGFKAMCERNGHLWGMARSVDEALDQVGRWGFLKVNDWRSSR